MKNNMNDGEKALRVLVIEDSEDDTLFLARELKRSGFEPSYQRVETMRSLASALQVQEWDLVISDHSMPGFGSLDALKTVRERLPDVPFIIVSGTIGEELAVRALKSGANDYVMKSHLKRLGPSVSRELREAESRAARRKAEADLRHSRQELHDFFEHAAVGLNWTGPHGTILRANHNELEMLGYSADEYVGHSMSEFYVDAGAADEVLKQLQSGGAVANQEVRLRCKDGSIRETLINANVYWENGKFIHARFCTRDVSEQKRGEQAAAYLAAIVRSSEDAIIGISLDGAILSWNAGAEQMYGYAAAEILHCSVSRLNPEFRPEEYLSLIEKIKNGEPVDRYETVRQRKDGTTAEISLSLSPIKDNAGQVIGVSAIERDIEARKREEAERLKLIAELTEALAKIKTLSGLLPICASCKKIRDDRGYWQRIETYISQHTNAEFTHGICPECLHRHYPEYARKT